MVPHSQKPSTRQAKATSVPPKCRTVESPLGFNPAEFAHGRDAASHQSKVPTAAQGVSRF